MEFEIASYAVGTNRRRSNPNHHKRWIKLFPKIPAPTANYVIIYFVSEGSNPNDSYIGYVTATQDPYVYAFARTSDFEDMYHILQTEKPVRFSWRTMGGNNPSLHDFQLYTGKEPVGEGLTDISEDALLTYSSTNQ